MSHIRILRRVGVVDVASAEIDQAAGKAFEVRRQQVPLPFELRDPSFARFGDTSGEDLDVRIQTVGREGLGDHTVADDHVRVSSLAGSKARAGGETSAESSLVRAAGYHRAIAR